MFGHEAGLPARLHFFSPLAQPPTPLITLQITNSSILHPQEQAAPRVGDPRSQGAGPAQDQGARRRHLQDQLHQKVARGTFMGWTFFHKLS